MVRRTAEPRSIAAIDEQTGPVALDTITPEDATGRFRQCDILCRTDPKTALNTWNRDIRTRPLT
jgi:hypothetical protein